jgi:lysophospholipase L1-like esterase
MIFICFLLVWNVGFGIPILEILQRGSIILTIGDSLTHGLCGFRKGYFLHPYSLSLSNHLNKHKTNTSDTFINVIENGENGLCSHEMFDRLANSLNESNPQLVIILTGTNDLAMKESPAQILHDIAKLHQMALAHANLTLPTYTIALTIPQLSWHINQTTRTIVNKGIRHMTQACHLHMALMEMENLFDQTDQSNHQYWSPDFVHFNTLGYDTIGELIYEVIEKFEVFGTRPSRNCLRFLENLQKTT